MNASRVLVHMKQKTYLLSLLALVAGVFFITSISHAEPVGEDHSDWMTDFKEAKAKAKAEGKPILVDFTGSDWCGWCIKLDKEVFSKKVFKDYAAENLILVEIDFPRKKEQSAELVAQNEALAEQYKIRGFPTILILDADGKVLKSTGYQRGGPENYIAHIKAILAGEEE